MTNQVKNLYVELKEKLEGVKTTKELDAIIDLIESNELNQDSFNKEIKLAKQRIDINLLTKAIVDLNVHMVGPKTAGDMAEYFKNARTLLDVVESGDLSQTLDFIKGVGVKTKSLIIESFESMLFLISLAEVIEKSYNKHIYDIKRKELSTEDIIELISVKPEVTQGIRGLNIAIVEDSFTEEELDEIKTFLDSENANINTSLYMATNYLLVGKDYETEFAFAKAKAYSIPVVSFDELKSIASSKLEF